MLIDLRNTPAKAKTLSAIAEVPAGAYIATDADGTLWAADVGDELVRYAAESPVWAKVPVDVEAYLGLMDRDYPQGCRQAARYLVPVDAEAARDALKACYAPILKPRTYLIEALRAAEARGVKVVVVSASPKLAAGVGLSLLGIDWPVVGIELHQGEVVEPAPVGEGKVQAWVARGWPQPALALGDSKWDLPLLHSAKKGLWVPHAARERLPAER